MSRQRHIIPRTAIQGQAAGLLLMAFFTMAWTAIAYGSMSRGGLVLLIAFASISVVFIVKAIQLLRLSKRLPGSESEQDKAEEKRSGKWLGIIFGAEGLGILIAINVVINLGHADLVIPVIALVVGLHFYPLAKVRRRTIDYYLATWTTLIAIIGIALILKKNYSAPAVYAFVAIAAALATSCYGACMIYTARQLLKSPML